MDIGGIIFDNNKGKLVKAAMFKEIGSRNNPLGIICLKDKHFTPAVMPPGEYPEEVKEGFETAVSTTGRVTDSGPGAFRGGAPDKRRKGKKGAQEEEDNNKWKEQGFESRKAFDTARREYAEAAMEATFGFGTEYKDFMESEIDEQIKAEWKREGFGSLEAYDQFMKAQATPKSNKEDEYNYWL